MTIPSYTSLGINDQPLVDSWQLPQPYLEPIQTDYDGGNKRLRSQPGDEVQQVQFAILMTNAEYSTFQNFVMNTLGKGTSRFTMRIWDGVAMVSKTVQFATRFKPTPAPPIKVQVSFDLWVYPS